MISHSCAMVAHVAMVHHTLGCALPILSPTEVEAEFSLKGNSNGSLLVLKLNFQDALFRCLDSSYCVSPAFLDVVYGGEVAHFSLCRLAMVAHVAVVEEG